MHVIALNIAGRLLRLLILAGGSKQTRITHNNGNTLLSTSECALRSSGFLGMYYQLPTTDLIRFQPIKSFLHAIQPALDDLGDAGLMLLSNYDLKLAQLLTYLDHPVPEQLLKLDSEIGTKLPVLGERELAHCFYNVHLLRRRHLVMVDILMTRINDPPGATMSYPSGLVSVVEMAS